MFLTCVSLVPNPLYRIPSLLILIVIYFLHCITIIQCYSPLIILRYLLLHISWLRCCLLRFMLYRNYFLDFLFSHLLLIDLGKSWVCS